MAQLMKSIVNALRKRARRITSPAERNQILFLLDSWRQSPNVLATPVNLHLEATNRCNLSCRTCGRNYWDKNLNPLGDMSLETVSKLDPYLKRTTCINLWGYGESLLSPRFFELMDYCGKYKGTIQLFTNGTTLTEDNAYKLIKKNLHSLVISLDGSTAETVQETRSGLSLNDLVDKVKRLIQLKAEWGMKHPTISFSFTASKGNISELPQLIRLAVRLGVAAVHVSIARIFHPSLMRESLLNDVPSAMEAFSQARQMGQELGLEVNVQDPTREGCRQPFELIFVKWNGDVFGCCASAFYSVPRFQIFLGNVHTLSLDAMWKGEYVKSIRKGLLGHGPLNDICGRCPYYKMTLENLQKYPVMFTG